MDYVDYALKEVPLPAEDAVPLQNCVSWLRQAIKNLQERGCAEKFDVDVFMDEALKSADIWMEERKEGGIPEEIEKINYTSRQFP